MPKFDLPLYIKDLNIDAQGGAYGTRRGNLKHIAKGIWVNSDLGPDERKQVLLRNSARVATKAFANSILAGSSAYHRGAVDGGLLLATPWGGEPVDIGGAFTCFFTRSQVDVGMNKEVEHVIIEDDFGPYTVKRLADDMLIIKNFQRKKGSAKQDWRPQSTFLNVTDLAEVVERAIRAHGSREALLNRLGGLMGHHGMSVYKAAINSFVEQVGGYTQEAKPLKAFKVYWHKTQVATLSHDGHMWAFDYEPNVALQLSVKERKGKRSTPSFLGSILPEFGMGDKKMEEKLDMFGDASRYISNITVHPTSAPKHDIIVDTLAGELQRFRTNKLEFTGRIDSSLMGTAEDESMLRQMRVNPTMPRISGMQVKLAAHLDGRGGLSSADGKTFTHILKVAGSGPHSSMGSMEWFSLTVAKQCGIPTEEFALVDLGARGPALLAERFDIRRDLNDTRHLLTEDFWSIAGMTDGNQKYMGELLDVADVLLKHSTEPGVDGRNLLSQAVFSWLTWNGDMHLKNLLLLKESKDPRRGFESIRLSPAYDILCTQVYPNDAKSSAIGLCGSRVHTLAGFRALGKKFKMSTHEVDSTINLLSAAIPFWARKVAANLPQAIQGHEESMEHVKGALELFDIRCAHMIAELDGAAKRKRSAKTPDQEAEEAAAAFSAEGMTGIGEHVEAELRRSWQPESLTAPTARPATSKSHP